MLNIIIVAGIIIAVMAGYIVLLHEIIDELRKNNNELKKQNKIQKLRLR